MQVSGGAWHSCGIEIRGDVLCWGDNAYGKATPPAGTFTQVSAGGQHSCGVRIDGTVVCWGDDTYDQTLAPTGSFTQVSAGWMHTCGVQTDGTAICWGYDGSGQAADPAGTFVQVSAGESHSCGVKTDSTLLCWGGNAYGERDVPLPDLTASKSHSSALTPAVGRPFAWTISVSNDGPAPAPLYNLDNILSDELPKTDLVYSPMTVTHPSGVTCCGHIDCAASGGYDLHCTVDGDMVVIHPGGSFDVEFSATPSVAGRFDNPRTDGECVVDPGSAVAEGDETNNDCSDLVAVILLTITQDGDDLLLEWTDVAADHYDLWTASSNPYAIPGVDCGGGEDCVQLSGNSHLDPGAATDGRNHYYLVEAVSATGSEFGTSNLAGKFVFDIVSGPP
jgi:hypothetical protein